MTLHQQESRGQTPLIFFDPRFLSEVVPLKWFPVSSSLQWTSLSFTVVSGKTSEWPQADQELDAIAACRIMPRLLELAAASTLTASNLWCATTSRRPRSTWQMRSSMPADSTWQPRRKSAKRLWKPCCRQDARLAAYL